MKTTAVPEPSKKRPTSVTATDVQPPNGAKFLRCTLQVNPFDYLTRHSKKTDFSDESSYNAALISSLKKAGVSVIAVTDHYRIKSSQPLSDAAAKAGLNVFRGFEAVSKEGAHFLVLFDRSKDWAAIDRVIGDCGIHDDGAESPTGKYDASELVAESKKWGAICIAAHVASNGGLLRAITGQARIAAWKSSDLRACSLPGPATDAPDDLRPILLNKNPDYEREWPMAVLNAQDISSPADVAKAGTCCWIKMSEVSLEGLRQAFLDPASRIRLDSDPAPEAHAEFLSIQWQGGFLDGAEITFNENLNVLIGGRGIGKSTVVESLRYVLELEPFGEEAIIIHEGHIKNVLRSGTKISVRVRSHHPTPRDYCIERTIPNPPIVRDDAGEVLDLRPGDIFPNAEIYGQHELSELTRSPEKLTRLLDRFVKVDHDADERRSELLDSLQKSRKSLLDAQRKLKSIDEKAAGLPAVEETLKRYADAGIEKKLKDRSLLVREENLLKTVGKKIADLESSLNDFQQSLPIDVAFIGPDQVADLPGKPHLTESRAILNRLSGAVSETAIRAQAEIGKATKEFGGIKAKWDVRKASVEEAYAKILRELQKSKIDGQEFIRLRQQVEELRPLKGQADKLRETERELQKTRRKLLAEWEEFKGVQFRELQTAAKRVTKRLSDLVQVQVAFGGNRQPLWTFLKDKLGGRLSETIDVLGKVENLSLTELAQKCRDGRDGLVEHYGLPVAQADRLAQMEPPDIAEIEELDLSPTTAIRLNVAPDGATPIWRALNELSTGQKATAVLLLLLLESDAPLVIDQPEDDLDNRFITESVVPKMREEKRRRQFIFATHNANIPVLGDAELIVGMVAATEPGQEGAQIPRNLLGSIDAKPVRELVEQVLEGGKTAFETRRCKYGF